MAFNGLLHTIIVGYGFSYEGLMLVWLSVSGMLSSAQGACLIFAWL